MRRVVLTAIVSILEISLARGGAAKLSEEAVNSASISDWAKREEADGPDPFIIRVQILLDRSAISPGVIDGYLGENLTKAVRAFEQREALDADGKIDETFWAALSKDSGPVLASYEIAAKDLSGRYVERIPDDYAEMAKLKWLGYTGPKEMLAERFHMDQSLLELLNPKADFSSAGETILVASIGEKIEGKATRVVVDRSAGELLAYHDDRLIAAYPASIGSADNPSPSGTHRIKVIVKDPSYSYNPDKNFKQGDNKEPLEIPPGPNGPVGSVWIDLSEPTYGIHGTAEPDLVDKTRSHGCVRLMNWDAEELAELVSKGVPVEFQE
jgi:lipoprotein-anchoring transpeptidase ErfK/SrfK